MSMGVFGIAILVAGYYLLASEGANGVTMASPNTPGRRLGSRVRGGNKGLRCMVLARNRCSRVDCTGRLTRGFSTGVIANRGGGRFLDGPALGLARGRELSLGPFSTSVLLGSNSGFVLNGARVGCVAAPKRADNYNSCVFSSAVVSKSALFYRSCNEASLPANSSTRVTGSVEGLGGLRNSCHMVPKRKPAAALSRREGCGPLVEVLWCRFVYGGSRFSF